MVKKLDKFDYGFKILSRKHCTHVDNIYIKDLRKLGRDLKDVIIVDNNPDAFSWNKNNGISIKSWYSDLKDDELLKFIPILQRLSQVNDVRDHIPYFVRNGDVNKYLAMRMLKKEEKKQSGGFLESLLNFKKGASNFFTSNKKNSISEKRVPSKCSSKSSLQKRSYNNTMLNQKQFNITISHFDEKEDTRNDKNFTPIHNSTKLTEKLCLTQRKPTAFKVVPKNKLSEKPYLSPKKLKVTIQRSLAFTEQKKGFQNNLLAESPSKPSENSTLIDDISEQICDSQASNTPQKPRYETSEEKLCLGTSWPRLSTPTKPLEGERLRETRWRGTMREEMDEGADVNQVMRKE